MAFLSTNPIKTRLIDAANVLVSPTDPSKRIRLLDWAVFMGATGLEEAYIYFGPSYTEGYVIAAHYHGTIGDVAVWSPDLISGTNGVMFPQTYRALLTANSSLFLGEPGESLGAYLSSYSSGNAGFFRYKEE